jgi:serine/threonine protein kinase
MSDPPFDLDQTRIRVPPVAQADGSRILPVGTRLEEFEILGLIGEGGFGIVYLAHDHSLERRLALKEYMPLMLACRRGEGRTITVRSQSEVEAFTLGLKSFVNEARLLARFDHPALLKVYRFWEGNGTAYMAMPFYPGPTLKRSLLEGSNRPNEDEMRAIINPLLDALTVLHDSNCYHRDIAPDNILLTSSGPLLLDFGAARRVITGASQQLTAILKDGYAPIEQYGNSASMRQGPWTDIYALCGVMRYAITGKAPYSAVDRLLVDRLEPLTQIASGQYRQSFLRAIDAGMSVRPEDRPQSIAAFRDLISRATDTGGLHPSLQAKEAEAYAPWSPANDATVLRSPAAAPPEDASKDHGRNAPSRIAIRGGAAMAVVTGFVLLLAYFAHSGRPSTHPGLERTSSESVQTPPPATVQPSEQTLFSEDAAAVDSARKSTEALLARARKIVTSNGGAAQQVLAKAQAAYEQGANALGVGNSSSTLADWSLARAETHTAVTQFLDNVIRKYSIIAQRKMNQNDLQTAQMAIDTAKELQHVKSDFP